MENRNSNLFEATYVIDNCTFYCSIPEGVDVTSIMFLSAVMMKDYETALKYCKLMNGNNEQNNNSSEDDDNDDEQSSADDSNADTDSSSSDDCSEDQEEEEIEIDPNAHKGSKGSSDGTTGSYSSLEDDEAELDQLAALAVKYNVDNADFGNGNKIYNAANMKPIFDPNLLDATKMTNNHAQFIGTSSDSESPTEPVTQQTIAMLRARVVPTQN